MLASFDPLRFELIAPLSSDATYMSVRQDVYNAIAQMQAGDHAYFFITQGSRGEWIKVLPVDLSKANQIPIERGQFGTTPTTFPKGSCVEDRYSPYKVAEMIQDAVDIALNNETEDGEPCPTSVATIEGEYIDVDYTDGECQTKTATVTLNIKDLMDDILGDGLEFVDGKIKLSCSGLPEGASVTTDDEFLVCKNGQIHQIPGHVVLSMLNACRENQ